MLELILILLGLAVLVLALLGVVFCIRIFWRLHERRKASASTPSVPTGDALPSMPSRERRGKLRDPASMPQVTPPRSEDDAEPDDRIHPNPFPTRENAMPLLPSGRSMHAPLVRFAIVAVIGAALLIPLVMMESLVSERSSLYDGVVHDISRTWGGSQHLSGPFLLIPFTERQLVTRQISERDAQGRMTPHEIKEEQEVLDYLVILPKTADFRGKLDPQERTRGIYRSLVYTADMTLNGSFTLPTREELERVAPALSGVDYAHAFVVMGLSYPNALRTGGPFRWNGDPLSAQPGTQPLDILKNGFRIPVRLVPHRHDYSFSQHLVLNGSSGIRFTPVGETTSIALDSPWPHPSFQGNVLPVSREVSAAGFSAVWNIPSLARSYANLGTLASWSSSFRDFPAGVDLYETSTHYGLIERSVKYGALFIGLTFLAFIVFEMGLRARLHPVQYGLVGLSMTVFYLVLLSLSEHLSFRASYIAAAGCTILMIAVYAGVALRNARQGSGIGLFLAALYTLLYAILQMEDYALLMGTALIVIMLGALMVVSRNLAHEKELRQ